MVRVYFLLCTSLVCLRGADASSFDAASIHPHDPDDSRFSIKMPSNGRFTATGGVAKLIVMLAYDVQETQIVGGPSWFATEKWDVEAKSVDEIPHSVEETRGMLQKLLQDRFALRIHRETQQRPAYVLTIAKGGPKFKASEQDGRTNIQVSSNS